MKKILIIAGEASSDMHASNLVKDIKQLQPDISFFGLGGNNMQNAGVDILENIVKIAFIGPGGLVKHYFKLKKIFNNICDKIKKDPPDCAILIDYAEFNLRVAKELKKIGVPVIYYISPQVWAWGLWRIKTIKNLVDKMIVFFKFEESLYKKHGVNVKFVGHPLLSTVATKNQKQDIIRDFAISDSKKIIGLLPGSRESEMSNILPIMLKTAYLIKQKNSNVEFIMPLASTLNELDAKKIISNHGIDIKIIKNRTYDAISICDSAIVASGTATLETALLGIPMAIVYKTNFLTYLFTKNLIKLPYIGLVNVVYGEKIVPEFLQQNATSKNISDYILELLSDDKLSSTMKDKFSEIKDSLGEVGASERAAREVVDFLDS